MTRLWTLMPERAVDLLAARMAADGDTPATALARLVAEDGPAPVVEWRDAVYRPLGNAGQEVRWKAIRDAAQAVRTTTNPFLRRAKA